MSGDPYVEGLAKLFEIIGFKQWGDDLLAGDIDEEDRGYLTKLRSLFIPREEFSALKAAADEMAGVLLGLVGLVEVIQRDSLTLFIPSLQYNSRVVASLQALSNYRNLTGGNDGDHLSTPTEGEGLFNTGDA